MVFTKDTVHAYSLLGLGDDAAEVVLGDLLNRLEVVQLALEVGRRHVDRHSDGGNEQ